MNHVPFQKENYRLDSITAFSNRHGSPGTDGFECVFQHNDNPEKFVTHLTGQRSHMPIYLRLWNSEVISHGWIVRIPKQWTSFRDEYDGEPLGLIVGALSRSSS
jgi:hypothetical protein